MINKKRLIDANAALERVCENCCCDFEECKRIGFCVDYTNIEQLPTVDAVEVVHGRWIEGKSLEKCSICGKKGFSDWHYCPKCGAKMDG